MLKTILFYLNLVGEALLGVVVPQRLLVLALIFGATQLGAQRATKPVHTLPRCNVGADPVNPNRQPTADEMVIVNPKDEVIRYKSGNGRAVDCVLPIGAPVVINKKTGVATWVYGCGNDLLSHWVPKRPPVEAMLPGPQGPQGPKGEKGDVGPQGPPGQVVYVPTAPAPDLFGGRYEVRGNGFPTWAKWLIGTGVAVGTAFVVANNWPHKGKPIGGKPVVITLPPTP